MPAEPDTSRPSTSRAIGFAQAQVGKRYCWGGTGPKCFDCSGLVQAAWRSGGVNLPRTSDAQRKALIVVPFDQMRPGDILWWRHHVGLYIGNGEMIDAYHSRAGVVRRRVAVPERVLRVVPR
jgi:peptidoglycan DL-endopeptidase CwlO